MLRDKILYAVATTIMSLIFLFSSLMYLFNYEQASAFYQNLGFPLWMIYPSAIAKLLALLAIWSKRSSFLKEWAYAGLFFDALMAFTAHRMAQDGMSGLALIALLAVLISRYFDGKLYH